MLEFIALGMVLDSPQTGYDIKKYIESGIGTFYKASYGSLYPLLKKLTAAGFLSVSEGAQGGRKKIYYEITDMGRSAFFEWLKAPINFNDSTDNQLAKIYFFDRLPEDERGQQLDEYELACTNYLRRLQAMAKEFDSMEGKDCFYYKLSTLYYGITVMQTTVKWCRQIRLQKPLNELIQ